MNKVKHIHSVFRKNMLFLAGVCLCLYFSYHTVSGHRSYSRLSELVQVADQKAHALDQIRYEKQKLEDKVVMLRDSSLSADMLEERARLILGYKYSDEYVIVTK